MENAIAENLDTRFSAVSLESGKEATEMNVDLLVMLNALVIVFGLIVAVGGRGFFFMNRDPHYMSLRSEDWKAIGVGLSELIILLLAAGFLYFASQ